MKRITLPVPLLLAALFLAACEDASIPTAAERDSGSEEAPQEGSFAKGKPTRPDPLATFIFSDLSSIPPGSYGHFATDQSAVYAGGECGVEAFFFTETNNGGDAPLRPNKNWSNKLLQQGCSGPRSLRAVYPDGSWDGIFQFMVNTLWWVDEDGKYVGGPQEEYHLQEQRLGALSVSTDGSRPVCTYLTYGKREYRQEDSGGTSTRDFVGPYLSAPVKKQKTGPNTWHIWTPDEYFPTTTDVALFTDTSDPFGDGTTISLGANVHPHQALCALPDGSEQLIYMPLDVTVVVQ